MISTLQESLRLVLVAEFLFVDDFLKFPGKGEHCSLLGVMLLLGLR